jgi:alkaline phosphatase
LLAIVKQCADSIALAQTQPFYLIFLVLLGKGSGLSFQNLTGYALVTTTATLIGQPSDANHYAPARSLLAGFVSEHEDGVAPLAVDQCGWPLDFSPLDFEMDGGNMVLWNDIKGGKYPWDKHYFDEFPSTADGFDPTFIMRHATDSANTAGTMATGVKTSVGMLSVDLYEEKVSTLIEDAMFCGKAGGAITSVPVFHATPGAFITHANFRGARETLRRNFINPSFTS